MRDEGYGTRSIGATERRERVSAAPGGAGEAGGHQVVEEELAGVAASDPAQVEEQVLPHRELRVIAAVQRSHLRAAVGRLGGMLARARGRAERSARRVAQGRMTLTATVAMMPM